MFGAGTGTPSTTVDWAMAEMLKNPHVMEKAQDELRNIFDGKSRAVDEEYLNEATYLKLVVKETLSCTRRRRCCCRGRAGSGARSVDTK